MVQFGMSINDIDGMMNYSGSGKFIINTNDKDLVISNLSGIGTRVVTVSPDGKIGTTTTTGGGTIQGLNDVLGVNNSAVGKDIILKIVNDGGFKLYNDDDFLRGGFTLNKATDLGTIWSPQLKILTGNGKLIFYTNNNRTSHLERKTICVKWSWLCKIQWNNAKF